MNPENLIRNFIQRKTIIVILGPTASGKTELSLGLSKFLDIEIISADSRQVYKYLNIGTAKPSKEQLSQVKHHFIDILEPDENYSAGKFADDADKIIDTIFINDKLPVVVGGSGLYIKALCEGLFQEENTESTDLNRKRLEERLKVEGIDSLYEELKKVDMDSSQKYTDKNPRRIIRALEYYYSTGNPISSHHIEKKSNKDYNVIYFGIKYPREELYRRINLRTEIMWKSGLAEETIKVIEMGYPTGLNSLNTVGYKETIAFLNNLTDENQTITDIQKNTRHYAKRQMTWFRVNDKIIWLDPSSKNNLTQQIYDFLIAMV